MTISCCLFYVPIFDNVCSVLWHFDATVNKATIRVTTPSQASHSRTFQGLSRPSSLKFKDPTRHSLRHGSRLITATTLRIFIMRTGRFYRSSQTTIKKRERAECVNTSQHFSIVLYYSDGRLCGLLPFLKIYKFKHVRKTHVYLYLFFYLFLFSKFTNLQGFQGPAGTP